MIQDAFRLGFLKEAQNTDKDILDHIPYGEDIEQAAKKVDNMRKYKWDSGEVQLNPDIDSAGLEAETELLGGQLDFEAEQEFDDNEEFSAQAFWTTRF